MRKSKTKISFFAFQDIITATTGILVLITIILTFFIKAGGKEPLSGPKKETLETENIGLNAQIGNLKVAIADLEEIIKKWGSKDAGQIEIEIQRQKDLISKYEDILKGLSEEGVKVRKMIDVLNMLKMQHTELVNRLEDIQKQVRDHREALADITKPNRVFIIPEIPPGKKLLYIVLSAGNVELIELIGENKNRRPLNNRATLLALLRNLMPKQEYHIMFFVRPSGIQDFLGLNGGMLRPGLPAPVSDLGFKLIGWEPLGEDVELEFR